MVKEYLRCTMCGRVLPITEQDLNYLCMKQDIMCECGAVIVKINRYRHEKNTHTGRQRRKGCTV